eukprot:7969113-Karenia_brevis.AAC.1
MPLYGLGDNFDNMIDDLEVPIAFIQPLTALLQQPSLLENVIGDQHLLGLISDVNLHTWFGVRGHDEVSLSIKGTRPGDPLADVLFNIQHGPTLADIDTDTRSSDLAWAPPQSFLVSRFFPLEDRPFSGNRSTSSATFADDSAFLGCARSAD